MAFAFLLPLKGQFAAHCEGVDTFNFSFFEDSSKEKEEAKEETPSSSAPPKAEEANADPFGFDAFDPGVQDVAEPSLPSEELELSPKTTADFDLDFESVTPSAVDQTSALKPVGTAPDLSMDLDDYPLGEPAILKADTEDVLVPDADFAASAEDIQEANDALNLDMDNKRLGDEEDMLEFSPLDAKPYNQADALADENDDVRAAVEPAVFVAPPEPVQQAPTTPAMPRVSVQKPIRFLTAENPFGEVAPPRERLRVAIIGASGIGKNHARWFAKHSCDVVSFLGSSDESVALTRSHLEAHMGFRGNGYSDLGQLLSQSQPQAVCISSPPGLHYAQAMQCLEAGVHVLCEKPLVYSPSQSRRENVDGARELQKFAARQNLVFGPQLQYGAATPILCRLAGVSPFEVGDFAMEVETTNPKAPRDPKSLWVELAPHPLAVAQFLAGEGAQILEDTVQLLPSRSAYTSEVSARFGVRCEGGRLLMCRAIIRWFDKIVDNREPRRRFAFNGRVVQYSGVKSPDGTFIAQYVAPDGYISHYSDPVDYLVGNFVRTCWDEDELLMSANQGVQNLDWLLAMGEKI